MPITSTSDFNTGKQYPPARETTRVHVAERHYNWSMGKYVGLNYTATPQRQFAQQETPQRLAINYFRWAADFFAASVVGSKGPVIESGNGNPRTGQFLAQLRPSVAVALQGVVRNTQRYGCGVLYSRTFGLESLDPRFWFRVAEPWDDQRTIGDVVAYPYASGDDITNNDRLYIAEHTATPSARLVKLDGLTIGAPIAEVTDQLFVDGAVAPVSNDDTLYGRSVYEGGFAQAVQEIWRRAGSVSSALDMHARPLLSLPAGSVDTASGTVPDLNTDSYVIPQPDGVSTLPAYIQWKAEYDSHFTSSEKAFSDLLRLAGISEALAQNGKVSLNLESSAGLRLLSIATVQKIEALRAECERALQIAIPAQAALLAAAGGEVIPVDDLHFTWQAPLSSMLDSAQEVRALREANALTAASAVAAVEGVSRDEALRLLEQQQRMEGNDGDATAQSQ